MKVLVGTSQIVAAVSGLWDTNHGLASVGVLTDRNLVTRDSYRIWNTPMLVAGFLIGYLWRLI